MGDIRVDNLASIGLVQDIKAHLVPPEAWTTATNMMAREGSMKRAGGMEQVLGTPGVAPYQMMYLSGLSAPWWIYAGLAKVYAYDFTTHYDITRASGGDYNATKANDWFIDTIGGIPILTNGIDVPQMWASFSGATDLTALTAWGANWKAKLIRAFGPYLVAFHITKSGTLKPHMVKWSHPADPGAVPASWDETDPTKDAGEWELNDVGNGHIQDAMMLRGQMLVYKDSSTWVMRLIGGRYIFSFDMLFSESGILAPHCVATINKGKVHAVLTQDDFIFHDGIEPKSIIDKRFRRALFNRIDVSNYNQSFVFHHASERQVWACYPESGSTLPTRALVWSYNEGLSPGSITEREINFVSAALGDLEEGSGVWSAATGTWESVSEAWGSGDKYRTVVAVPSATKMCQLGVGLDNDGTGFTAILQREGLSLIGQRADGSPIVDFSKWKLVTRVWIVGAGRFMVRLGSADTVEGPVTWSDPVNFDADTMKWVDITTEGVSVAIEFKSTDTVDWRIDSYTLETVVISRL